jgi:hypothetical protein
MENLQKLEADGGGMMLAYDHRIATNTDQGSTYD